MDSSKIKSIAFDLDGTALDSKGRLSNRLVTALLQLSRSGLCLIACTSRPLDKALPALRPLMSEAASLKYIIFLGGCGIHDTQTGKCIFFDKLNPSDIGIIAKDFQRFDYFAYTKDRCIKMKSENDFAFPKKIKQLTKFLLKRGESAFYNRSKFVNRKISKEAYKISSFHIPSEEKIRQFRAALPSSNVFINVNELEITNINVNKFYAMRYLEKQSAINLNETIFFGDSENDVMCLQKIPFSVAMKNATPQISSFAFSTTREDNDHDGVGRFLEDNFKSLSE